jgi:glycosyltransferase involved in cell wall biosynthesis
MPEKNLLIFNLATDADSPILGFTTAWVNALAERCASVDVITMTAGRLDVQDNVRVFSVGKEKGYSEPRRAFEFYRILRRLMARKRYQACFAHMMPLFAVMGAPLLKLYRVPITLWYTHKSVTPILRLAERWSDQVVTASAESFRIDSPKVVITGHGVDTALFQPGTKNAESAAFTILSAGRIAPVKRLEILIDAARLLRHEHLPAALRIVGEAGEVDRVYGEQLRAQVKNLQLGNAVKFAGGVNHGQMAGEYHNADVMVNVSNTGSIDKAVLEAMACGLPVITSNEAFQTMLAPWSDLLWLPEPSSARLAAQIKALMAKSPQERNVIGLQLRQIVIEQHSFQRLIDQLAEILDLN